MRYTEQGLGIMEEYETLKMNQAEVEESLQSRRLWLEERNALEHALDLLAGELEDARWDRLSLLQEGSL